MAGCLHDGESESERSDLERPIGSRRTQAKERDKHTAADRQSLNTTGINPGWTCDCRQLYLTQELDLLCMGIVVVLTKSFISFVTKNKYLAVNPPSTSAEIFGVSQK